ncbi:unnamed protein product [Parajaminaea phylloscopi]
MPSKSHGNATAASASSSGHGRGSPARRQQQQSAAHAPVASTSAASSSSRQRSSLPSDNEDRHAYLQGMPNERQYHHHPFRIEVQDITPVSISLRWSLRPPPISEFVPLQASAARRSKRSDQRASQGDGSLAEGRGEGERHSDDDDDATAVDESSERDEDFAEDMSSGTQRTQRPLEPSVSSSLGSLSSSSISVVVNGAAWSQVVLAEQEPDESVVVVYGLRPDQDYELELSVNNRGSGKSAVIATRTGAPSQNLASANQDSPAPNTIDPAHDHHESTSSRGTLCAPQGDTPTPHTSSASHGTYTEAGHGKGATTSHHVAELEAAESLRDSVAAELRQARKEASRAEQALRNEIEALKRSLDRMSSADHRSKQKVLALQELIRQANQSAKEVAEEAEAIEGEQEHWRRESDDLAQQEQVAEKHVNEAEQANHAQIRQEEDSTAALEKELSSLQKSVGNKEGELDKVLTGKVAELERQVADLEAEAHRIESCPTPPLPQPSTLAPGTTWHRWGPAGPDHGAYGASLGAGAGPASGFRSVSGPAGSSRGQRGERGGSGGRGGMKGGQRNALASHSHGNFHRRGRGGGSTGSVASHTQQQQNAYPPFASPLTAPAQTVHALGPQIGTHSQAAGEHELHGQHAPPGQVTATSSFGGVHDFAHNAAPMYSGSRTLNPTSVDFVPSSAHASPVIGKRAGASPTPPHFMGAGQPAASWGTNSDPSGSADFAAIATAPGSGIRALRQGVGSGSNLAINDLHEPSIANVGPPYNLASANSLNREAPAGPLGSLSQFGPGSGVPPFVMQSSIPSFQDTRRPSFGPLDYTDDSVFDPTAPAPLPYGGGGPSGNASNNTLSVRGLPPLISSPWNRGTENVSPALGSVAPSNSTGNPNSSPWSSSSPMPAGMGVATDDIWATGPPLPSASARALRKHPSLLIGSSSVFGQPHRSGSGNSSSSHSAGGHASSPASPTTAQRAGSFGAIGVGKMDPQPASLSGAGETLSNSPLGSPVHTPDKPAREDS